MEIKQLKALRAIVETGSFSLAAEKLWLTQSALSHQIKNLEEELGETLLIRKPAVVPTASGHAVLRSADRILAEVKAIHDQFQAAGQGPATGTLRIAATNLGMAYLYGDICQEFMARYPAFETAFRATETPEEAAKGVEEGTADAAFIPFIHDHPLLDLVPLGTTSVRNFSIVGRRHPLFKRRVVGLDEIRQWPFI